MTGELESNPTRDPKWRARAREWLAVPSDLQATHSIVQEIAKEDGTLPREAWDQLMLAASAETRHPTTLVRRVAQATSYWTRFIGKALSFHFFPPSLPRIADLGVSGAEGSTSAGGPRFSVVLLSCNRKTNLDLAIHSFRATTRPADCELIVVDNGSTDGSVEFLLAAVERRLADKVILLRENRGISAGFNCGFAHADPRSQFLSRVDDDIVFLSPGWMEAFTTLFSRNSKIGVLALDQVNHAGISMIPPKTVDGTPVRSWHGWVCGASCMTLPRHVFERFGWFQEALGQGHVMDDVDYYSRLALSGYEGYYVEQFRCVHRDVVNPGKYMKRKTWVKRQEGTRKVDAIILEYMLGERELCVRTSRYAGCTGRPGERVIRLD